MKKLIKQDGVRRVYIYDDGSEEPFENIKSEKIESDPIDIESTEKPKKKKGRKKLFDKEDD